MAYDYDYDYERRLIQEENLLAPEFSFHDFYDLFYFALILVKVLLHLFEMYQLFTHRLFIDNLAKPIIVYLHITSIVMLFDNFLWTKMNHIVTGANRGSFFNSKLVVPPKYYVKGFWAYCFIFESHLTIFICMSVYSAIGYWKKTSSYEMFRYYNLPILTTGIILPALYVLLGRFTHFRWMRPGAPTHQANFRDQHHFEDLNFYSSHMLFIGIGLGLFAVSEFSQTMLIIARAEWPRLVLRLVHLVAAFASWMLVPMVALNSAEDYSNLTAQYTLYSCFVLFLVQVLGRSSE